MDARKVSERRLAENEVIVKDINERFQGEAMDVLTQAKASNEYPLFYHCECSNPSCAERFQCQVDKYRQVHEDSKQFMIVPGHEVPEIEQIVERTDQYVVVEKRIEPPKL